MTTTTQKRPRRSASKAAAKTDNQEKTSQAAKKSASDKTKTSTSKIDFGALGEQLNWDDLRNHKRPSRSENEIRPKPGSYVAQLTGARFVETRKGVKFLSEMTIRGILSEPDEDGNQVLLSKDQDEFDQIGKVCVNWHSLDNGEVIESLGRTQAEMWKEWLDDLEIDVSQLTKDDIAAIPTYLLSTKVNPNARPWFDLLVTYQDGVPDWPRYRIIGLYSAEDAKEMAAELG